MKKFIINLVCCLVPSKKLRHKIRRFAKRTKPQNNIIEVVKTDGRRVRVKRVSGCEFTFTGDNNHVVLHEPLGNLLLKVCVSSGVYIELKSSTVYQRRLRVIKRGGDKFRNKLIVGRDFASTDWVYCDFCCGGGDIIIGDDCLFANGILWTGDFHAITDVNSGRVLNHNKSIVIGNHVWFGSGVRVLKGGGVSDNTIVAMQSLIAKSFNESNVVLGGVPARIIKRGVDWDREFPDAL